jgi:3-methyladenine DNA glycosylase AlkD
MKTAEAIVTELKKKGTEQTRKIYARHGMNAELVLGVSTAVMKAVAKELKGQQALAMALYKTGWMEAMYVAGLVASGAKMTDQELQAWAEGASGLQMIAEYTVPWVAVEHPSARETALRWIESKDDHLAAVGWRTYAGLLTTKPDDSLDLKQIDNLLTVIEKKIHTAPNRIRFVMNGFVITTGTYVAPLLDRAKAAAKTIGAVQVDVGDTACKVPLASAAIGSIRKKKKTLRC